MGKARIELVVYSCDCGWIGQVPDERVVEKLEQHEMGKVVKGSRGAKKLVRLECPVCNKAIVPSPPRDLLEVTVAEKAIEEGPPKA